MTKECELIIYKSFAHLPGLCNRCCSACSRTTGPYM